jgi:transaldolase
MNLYESYRSASMTSIDTAHVDEIEALSHIAHHVTTNPSLIYRALSKHSSNEDIDFIRSNITDHAASIYNLATALFAKKILPKIPGDLSLQIDPRKAYNFEESLQSAYNLIETLEKMGTNTDKILLKVASTESGFKLIYELQRKGIRCNATCVMSLGQAQKAVDNGASMIACYVARIKDWYDKNCYILPYHPGIVLTEEILSYLTESNPSTKLMAASFRTLDEVSQIKPKIITTVSPTLLKQSHKTPSTVVWDHKASMKEFYQQQDVMHKEKVAESLQKFSIDTDWSSPLKNRTTRMPVLSYLKTL